MTDDQISVQELHTLLNNKQNIFILDVRTPEEFRAGHMNGHLIPLAELAERVDEIPRDRLVVIHCRSGMRSQTALNFLKSLGYTQIKNLIGGIEAWDHYVSSM